MGLLNDWPLPTGDDEVRALWERNEQLQNEYDEPPHPDELNDRINIIHKDWNWRVFTIPIYGFGSYIYFWNHSGDYGFYIDNLEDDTEALRRFFESWAAQDGRQLHKCSYRPIHSDWPCKIRALYPARHWNCISRMVVWETNRNYAGRDIVGLVEADCAG